MSLFVGLTLIGCSNKGSLSGTVVDPLTGQPRSEIRIIAEAEPMADDLTCQVREGQIGPDGTFVVPDLCGETTYKLRLSDDTLFVPGAPTITGGTDQSGLKLEAWRAPTGAGLYQLADDTLSAIRSNGDIDSETISKSEEKVLYPSAIPKKPPVVEKGYFIISGAGMIDGIELLPLIPHEGTMRFPTGPRTWVDIEGHAYVGTRFASNTKFERVPAADIDMSKTKKAEEGDRSVLYVPVEAVANGRYVAMRPQDKRVTILDWGASETPE